MQRPTLFTLGSINLQRVQMVLVRCEDVQASPNRSFDYLVQFWDMQGPNFPGISILRYSARGLRNPMIMAKCRHAPVRHSRSVASCHILQRMMLATRLQISHHLLTTTQQFLASSIPSRCNSLPPAASSPSSSQSPTT